jgi:hypothetical protein
MTTNYTKWPWILPNGHKIYQHLPFKGPPKFTQVGIFGLKTNHLATLTHKNNNKKLFHGLRDVSFHRSPNAVAIVRLVGGKFFQLFRIAVGSNLADLKCTNELLIRERTYKIDKVFSLKPWRCGIVVIASVYRIEDPVFESRQGVWFFRNLYIAVLLS